MRKRLFSIVTIVVVISGCTQAPVKEIVVAKKNSIEQQQDDFDVKLEEILTEKGSFIEVRGLNKKYKEGEKISFVVDTKDKVGYLYIISVDKDKVVFLQPNPDSPLSQMRGVRSFPEDFTDGGFYIKATKSCTNCEEEKTTVYALLTKRPIEGVEQKITGDNLLGFFKNSQKARGVMKGISRVSIQKSSSNLSIGRAEFFID